MPKKRKTRKVGRTARAVPPASAPPTGRPVPAPTRPPGAAPGPPAQAGSPEPRVYGVAPTYWLEDGAELRPVRVHFTGRGTDDQGRSLRFERTVPVPPLPVEAGRTSITTRVPDLPAGAWEVVAQGLDESGRPLGDPQSETMKTRLAPLVRGPGVRPAAWPSLVLLGVVVAIVMQVLLVRTEGLDASSAAVSAVVATLVGYLTAKVAYMVANRVPPSGFAGAGTLIQFFLLGAFGTLLTAAVLVDLPVRRVLDLTAPGVFAAMALARPGCWLGGCCAGRPTASRWGLWSSDRRVGVRRVPVQLMESLLAAAISAVGLLLVLTTDGRPAGAVLALSAALYTLGRQGLFPLRAEARRTSRGRQLVAVAAAGVAVMSFTLLVR